MATTTGSNHWSPRAASSHAPDDTAPDLTRDSAATRPKAPTAKVGSGPSPREPMWRAAAVPRTAAPHRTAKPRPKAPPTALRRIRLPPYNHRGGGRTPPNKALEVVKSPRTEAARLLRSGQATHERRREPRRHHPGDPPGLCRRDAPAPAQRGQRELGAAAAMVWSARAAPGEGPKICALLCKIGGFDFLDGAKSFDNICDEINRAAESSIEKSTLCIVSWNLLYALLVGTTTFFALKVEANKYYIIDTLGLHVVVVMFTGYLVGFAAFRALFSNSPVLNAAGIILGLVGGMLVETVLFILRSSSKELPSSVPRSKKVQETLEVPS